LNSEEDEEKGISGALVIEENLRQICVFKLLNATGAGLKWWNYIENFQGKCTGFTKECADGVLSSPDVGLTAVVVQKCMDDAGGVGEYGGENSLLEEEMMWRIRLGVWEEPTVLINEITYRGSYACEEPIDVTTCGVLAAICSGYLDQSVIPACTSSPGCSLGEVRDVCNVCGGHGAYDACGKCNQPESDAFNSTCKGCDGVPNSGLVKDNCDVCGGIGKDLCDDCKASGDTTRVTDPAAICGAETAKAKAEAAANSKATGLGIGPIIGIVAGTLFVVGIAAALFVRHRNAALKQDIDALLKQYLPM
jgi:hypothetical protein